MTGYRCPHCNRVMAVAMGSMTLYRLDFQNVCAFNYSGPTLDVRIYRCPACDKFSVVAEGRNGFIDNAIVGIYPNTKCRVFPDYIPLAIRQDYEEACKIMDLSPKAAATLARRCLQGMIRDFHNIRKHNLNEEISALRGTIPETQWNAINALRKIGNIGAHMEKDVNLIVDVEPAEAAKLVALIELLIEKWYVARHDEEELLNEIVGMADAKAQLRAKPQQ